MKEHRAVTKILLVTTALLRAGAEQQASALALGLAKRGWSVALMSLRQPLAYVDEIRGAGIELYSLEMEPGRVNIRGVIKAVRLIRQIKPTIVHCHLFHATLLLRLLRIVFPIRLLICTAHSEREESLWREWIYRLTDPLCDMTSHVSRNACAEYVARRVFKPKKTVVIHNGIELERFVRNDAARHKTRSLFQIDDAFVWLYPARLEPIKNHALLLLAFSDVVRSFPSTILLLAGTGSLKSNLERLTEELKLESRVRFLGESKDVASLLNGADGVVVSSSSESFGIAIIEALAVGKSVVSTACAGPREILSDGAWGTLVPPNNAQALSFAMIEMMRGKSRIPKYEVLRDYIRRHYSIDAMIDAWEHIYDQCLRRSRL
jgi:glycosyltransferase involved in cell wall biosynthesis